MRRALLLGLMCAVISPANTIFDVFHQSQAGGCNYGMAAPFSACDIIGDPAVYDIQKASVELSQGWAKVTIYFNYGGGITLQPFLDDGITLAVGDLFFYDPADPQSKFQYGVPLSSHGGFTADALYAISGATTLRTSDDILHNTGIYYRRTLPVWLGGSGVAETTGLPVLVTPYGDGITNAKFAATLQFPTPLDFITTVVRNGNIGIAFASAYCGNDVLQGVVEAVPEPEALILVGAGLALLAVSRLLRRWTS